MHTHTTLSTPHDHSERQVQLTTDKQCTIRIAQYQCIQINRKSFWKQFCMAQSAHMKNYNGFDVHDTCSQQNYKSIKNHKTTRAKYDCYLLIDSDSKSMTRVCVCEWLNEWVISTSLMGSNIRCTPFVWPLLTCIWNQAIAIGTIIMNVFLIHEWWKHRQCFHRKIRIVVKNTLSMFIFGFLILFF